MDAGTRRQARRYAGRQERRQLETKMPKFVDCLNARVYAAAHGLFHLFGQFYHDWLILETPPCTEKEPGYFRE